MERTHPDRRRFQFAEVSKPSGKGNGLRIMELTIDLRLLAYPPPKDGGEARRAHQIEF